VKKDRYGTARAELGEMLSLLPGDWDVVEIGLARSRLTGRRRYAAVGSRSRDLLLVSGRGRTKAEALEDLLENWRKGLAEGVPAAGSAEELRLKLEVAGKGEAP